MEELYYTILVNGTVVDQNVRAEYVPRIIRSILTGCFANHGLNISIEA